MRLISHPRRSRRSGEWTSVKAVTFIVALAATNSVTLAARRAGMSRKSAYALKSRDPSFASAWTAAARAATAGAIQGDKVEEVDAARIPPRQGYRRARMLRRRVPKTPKRMFDEMVTELRESVSLAPWPPAQ